MVANMPNETNTQLVIKDAFTQKHADTLASTPHFDEIKMHVPDLITTNKAKAFAKVRSVHRLFIWSSVTRAAIRHFISRPNLRELILFQLKPSGRLEDFDQATGVTYFSSMWSLSPKDLLEIAKLPQLQKLGAQYANLSDAALEALLEHEHLQEIDFEGTNFNDRHAAMVAKSRKITRLEIGATSISALGLDKICQMQQLKGLDIWASRIRLKDLNRLSALNNLEYLSIGGMEGQTEFNPETIFPILQRLPSVKKIWLDGLTVTKQQRQYLDERYEYVGPMYIID